MAHDATQVALVNDVEAQGHAPARRKRATKARLESVGVGEVTREGRVGPAGGQILAGELQGLDFMRIEIDLETVPFRAALRFSGLNVERLERPRFAIEFMEYLEAAPLTSRIGRERLCHIGSGKSVGQRFKLSRLSLQEQSLHGHAAEAPSLQLSDTIAGSVARDEIGTEKEMRFHLAQINGGLPSTRVNRAA